MVKRSLDNIESRLYLNENMPRYIRGTAASTATHLNDSQFSIVIFACFAIYRMFKLEFLLKKRHYIMIRWRTAVV